VTALRTLSATDLTIALAIKKGTLRFVERNSRFGDKFVTLEDSHGLIEVHDNIDAAYLRVSALVERMS